MTSIKFINKLMASRYLDLKYLKAIPITKHNIRKCISFEK